MIKKRGHLTPEETSFCGKNGRQFHSNGIRTKKSILSTGRRHVEGVRQGKIKKAHPTRTGQICQHGLRIKTTIQWLVAKLLPTPDTSEYYTKMSTHLQLN